MDDLAEEDARFDAQLPRALQLKSADHFTSIDIARRVARLLAPTPGTNILDVGSGVGKFCITAALEMPHAQFVGVEWRPHLVELATRIAEVSAASNVRFIHGDAMDLDWREFDAFYLFNPFGEQEFDPVFVLDGSIDFDHRTFVLHVTGTRQRLALARIGTRLVTYHGFGAPPPLGYELVTLEAVGRARLELWVKTRSSWYGDSAEEQLR